VLTLLAHGDDAQLPQNSEVLGNVWLPNTESQNDGPDRQAWALREQIDDLPSPRLGDGTEDVGPGRSSSHVSNIFRLRNMSSHKRANFKATPTRIPDQQKCV
jgi:hypothetical protein